MARLGRRKGGANKKKPKRGKEEVLFACLPACPPDYNPSCLHLRNRQNQNAKAKTIATKINNLISCRVSNFNPPLSSALARSLLRSSSLDFAGSQGTPRRKALEIYTTANVVKRPPLLLPSSHEYRRRQTLRPRPLPPCCTLCLSHFSSSNQKG